jgi:hypothetical protein
MRTSARHRRPARTRRHDDQEREIAARQAVAQGQEQFARALSELQAQITAHQLAIALAIKILAARADEDGEAIEVAMYVAAEERVEQHGEIDELAKALRAMHILIREALNVD